MADKQDKGNGQITIRLYTMIFLIVLGITTAWGLALYVNQGQTESQACINEVEQVVTSNTQRIKTLERQAQAMSGIPAQISSMSTDLKYLRKLVETLAADWHKRNTE